MGRQHEGQRFALWSDVRTVTSARGFTILEALVAASLVATALAGIAHLIVISAAQTSAATRETTSLALAQSKLEELRAVRWGYAVTGTRESSAILAASPSDALARDVVGYVDELDRYGGATVGATTAYRRRWKITAFDPTDPDTLRLECCVFTVGAASPAANRSDRQRRVPGRSARGSRERTWVHASGAAGGLSSGRGGHRRGGGHRDAHARGVRALACQC